MPVPASINDLSTTAASNSPARTESPITADDYLRTHASFIAQLRDADVNLGNASDAAKGAALVGYRGRAAYARLSEVLYAQDFGAKGDGATIDTSALQTAINTAAAAGKTLFLPSGTYLTGGLTLPSKARLVGHGAILKLTANTDANLLVNSDITNSNTDIYLEGIELDGNKLNQGATSRALALFKKCTYVTLRGVVAHDAKIASYTTDAYDQVLFVDCYDCTVEECESYNSDQGGLGFYGTGGRHKVLRNYIHDCPAGIEGAYQTDSQVIGNHVRNSSVALISWNGLRNWIEGNLCTNSSDGAGIVCGHGGTPVMAADGSWVINNTIRDVYSYGVTVYNSADVLVAGNKIKRATGNSSHSIFVNTGCVRVTLRDNDVDDYVTSAAGACGVFVDSCADARVTGNRVRGAMGGTAGDGIRMYGACDYAIVEGNTIVSPQGDGIDISTGTIGAVVRGNHLRSLGVLGIRVAGTGAVIDGNIVLTVTGAQGILVGANQCVATGNRVSGVTSGSGIYINAADYNAVVGNIVDNCSVGINVPSGSDYCVEAANVMSDTVTTKLNVGTVTGNKAAHNIGVATHDV